MILPKRVVYCLLFALATAVVLFRYPVGTYHELGSDTTFINSLADSVVQNGRALWVLSPLSYFGLYSLSYPSAMPFFFASGSMVSGIPIEGVTLVSGWGVALAAAFGAFLLARAIRRDDAFALLVATLFALAPFFVKDTFWVEESRGFVVALLPAFLLLLVRSLKMRGARELVLALAILLVMGAIHRMGLLAIFFLVAFAFALPFHEVTQKLRFAFVRHERSARYAIVLTAVFGFIGVFYLQFLNPGAGGANVVEEYGAGAFFQGTSFPILVANMAVSLAGKIGVLFPFMPIGIVMYVWHRPKEIVDKFLLTATILFLPLLSARDYMGEFLIPLFVILIVVGLMWLWKREEHRKLIAIGMVLLLAGSSAFAWEMKDYWRNRYGSDAPISNTAYEAGIYVLTFTDGTIITNEPLTGGQIAAVSGRPVMPLGGASLHWFGPQLLTWGYVDGNSVQVKLMPIEDISFNTDEIYVGQDLPNAEVAWETMLFYTDPFQADRLFSRYHVHYVVLNVQYPQTFVSYGHERYSNYLQFKLPSTQYKVYDNAAFTTWYRG